MTSQSSFCLLDRRGRAWWMEPEPDMGRGGDGGVPRPVAVHEGDRGQRDADGAGQGQVDGHVRPQG